MISMVKTSAAEFQRAHFGQIIFNGDELADYCLWQKNLNEKQAGEWEKILDSLQPGQGVKKKLEAFKQKVAEAPVATPRPPSG